VLQYRLVMPTSGLSFQSDMIGIEAVRYKLAKSPSGSVVGCESS
jgi:hypothetical protein